MIQVGEHFFLMGWFNHQHVFHECHCLGGFKPPFSGVKRLNDDRSAFVMFKEDI